MYSPILRSVLVLTLTATILMIIDRSTDWLRPIRHLADSAVRPLYWITEVPGRIEQWSVDQFSRKDELIEENRRLRQERLIYRGRLHRMSELAAENLRLLQLLNASKLLIDSVLLGEVIGISPTAFRHTLTVDRGFTDGINVGQPVLDAEGLMGQVIEVYKNHSIVLLITDASHAIPVKVLRNGVRSIAEGTADYNRLSLRFVSPTADIKLGDQLVSSGLGERFPAGYPVGVISSIEDQPGSVFVNIEVKPSASLDVSTHVLFVFSAGSEHSGGNN